MVPIFNLDFIICMGVIIIGFVMFGLYGYIEQGKEIGIEKALGMTNLQLAYTFIVEFLVLLIFGIFFSNVIGIIIVEVLLSIFDFSTQLEPSLAIFYPFEILIQYFLLTFLIGFLGLILPIYFSTKRDISRVLKVE